YDSFTYPQVGKPGGAVVDGGMLILAKIGRIRLRLHRPLAGTPKTVTLSREADGWDACISCAEVPNLPLPRTNRETGIDVGLQVRSAPPRARWSTTRATPARRRRNSPKPTDARVAATKGAVDVVKQPSCLSACSSECSGSDGTFITRPH